MITLLNTLCQTGSRVTSILSRMETLGVPQPSGHGKTCLALLWYNGPHSKGPQNITRHTDLCLDFDASAHAKIEAADLAQDLVKAETAFFTAAKAFAKAMSGAAAFKTLKSYPAFRFELYASGGHVGFEIRKEAPMPTFGGIEDFLFPNHWDVFAQAMNTLYTLEGIGNGNTYCVAKGTHTPLSPATYALGDTHTIQAPDLQSAHTFGSIAYFPRSLVKAQDITTFKMKTPTLNLTPTPVSKWEGVCNVGYHNAQGVPF